MSGDDRAAPQSALAAGFLVAGCLGVAGALAALGADAMDLAWFALSGTGVCAVAFVVVRPRHRRDGGLANPIPQKLLWGGPVVLAFLLAVLFLVFSGERIGIRRGEPGVPPDEASPSAASIIAFRRQADLHGVLVVSADDDTRTMSGFGSGVVVRRSGDECLVLTAAHVVAGSPIAVIKCYAEWSGGVDELCRKIGTAEEDPAWSPVLLENAGQDWALCVLHDPGQRANPPDTCRSGAAPGEWVLALGNPGTGTAFHDDGHLRGYHERAGVRCLLHDALLDRGSSGGPLFGSDFSLIGINIGSWTPPGAREPLGVALPAHDILRRVNFVTAEISCVGEGWTDLGIDLVKDDIVRIAVRSNTPGDASHPGMWRARRALEYRIMPGEIVLKDLRSDFTSRVPRVEQLATGVPGRLFARAATPLSEPRGTKFIACVLAPAHDSSGR